MGGVIVAPAAGLGEDLAVGIFQDEAPGVVLDEEAPVSGGIEGAFAGLFGFPKGTSVGRFGYEHGVVGIFLGNDGRGEHADAQGTLVDGFDSETELRVVVVGSVGEVEGL